MRKFRKNGVRTVAFLMAVSVALGSSPSTVFAASETEGLVQIVEQNQERAVEGQETKLEEITMNTNEQVTEEVTTEITTVDENVSETEATEEVTTETTAVDENVSETEAVAEEEGEDSIAAQTYVLMNIPFDKFYENELNNDVAVDGFTSATLNKTRTKSMVGNTYHVNADGSDITGIIFPVLVKDGVDLSAYKQVTDDDAVTITVTNRGQTNTVEYKGKDALFENPSYSYYKLDGFQSMYKEVSVGEDGELSFSKIISWLPNSTLKDVETTLSTKSNYGDYQLNFAGDSLSNINSENIYSVIVSTIDGSSYAMRPLGNVWIGTRGIAWTSTNNIEAVHNCPTNPAHYVSLMGKSISKITYYTSDGIFDIPVNNIYVPIKIENEKNLVIVENASAKAGKTAVSVSLPDGFEPEYKVEGLENVAVADGEMTFTATKIGNYTLTVSDKSGKYADLTASFTLTTEDMPAAYNGNYDTPALVTADGYSTDDLSAYINNITSVSVDGKEYAASGRGAVVIVKEDGTIDMSAAPFAEAKDRYDITVKSTGYTDSSFVIQKIYNIENMDIELSKEKYTYSGKAITPYAKIINGDAVLNKSVDYKVTYKNNVQPGIGTVIVTGIGNYKGTITKKFNIYPAKLAISGISKVDKGLKVKWTEVVGASGYEIYRSKNDGEYSKVKKITSGSTVEWADTTANTNGAKYSYKILAYTEFDSTILKSKQSATKATYKVKTPVITSLTSSVKKQMTVKWQKNTQATYYEIQYSMNSNFSNARTVKVIGVNNISKVIYNLKAGKKYYVRIRGSKTVNKGNYCSAWSEKKAVTIKK
ncbi:MAG: hemoblobin-interacting domain-containing protein [Lachnospiraceae bacterium]